MAGWVGGPGDNEQGELDLVFEFDKFMDDITKREKKASRPLQEEEMSPQRKYWKRYRDSWQNRTRVK